MNRRSQRHGALRAAAMLVAVAAICPAGAVAAERPPAGKGKQVAEAFHHSAGLDLVPSVRYSRAFVTVAGNGAIFRREVAADERLSVGIFDPAGQLLPDGLYRWEVVLVPDAAAAATLRQAAAENGGKAPGAWRRETGTFAIRNGLIASGDLSEGESAERGAAAPAAAGRPAPPPAAVRGPAKDDDYAVGLRVGVEASMRGAGSGAPAAPEGILQHADRRSVERSDIGALELGQSLEALVQPGDGQSRAPSARKSVFDNKANGRPRSDKPGSDKE